MKKTELIIYPMLITIVASLLMLITLFLPFGVANDSYKGDLMEKEEEMFIEEIEMTNGDAVNLSLFEFTKLYSEFVDQDIDKEANITCIVVIYIFAGFAVLTLIMSITKLPIGIIIADIIAMGVFKLVSYDFSDRGVVPGDRYDLGIAGYIVYVLGVIVIAGAVWLFIEKRKAKKALISNSNV